MMEWEKYLEQHPPQGFKPLPSFSRVGDMIRWYWSDEEGYADPIYYEGIHIGSLIRSFKTKEIVGVKIHNILALVQKAEQA